MAQFEFGGARHAQPSMQWENHPRYGIVHASGCDVCSSYISHLIDAAFDNEPSFRTAREDLTRGLASSLAQQRNGGDKEDGKRYEVLLDESRKEIDVLRAQLEASRAECDELKNRNIDVEESDSGAEDAIDVYAPSYSDGRASPPYYDDDISPTTGEFSTHWSSIPWDAVDHSFPHRQTITKPRTVKEMKALMFNAHQPGNEDALLMVQELCREAHETRRDERMDFQKYLLSAWRRPVSLDADDALRYAPSGLENPTFDAPAEEWHAYYDARPPSFELPRGVRRDDAGRPILSDVKAFQIIARLGPTKSEEHATIRSQYKPLVVTLFFIPELYLRVLARLCLDVSDTVAYAPIRHSSESQTLTMSDVARHFAACGITVDVAENELGPWARESFVDAMRKGEGEKVLELLSI